MSASNSIPNSLAIAGMCKSEFVEPEIAAWTIIAFSKDFIVTMSLGLRSFFASHTACSPAFFANSKRSGLVAGINALPGSIKPRASAITCIVDAVPINEQAPQEGQALCL